MIVRTRPRRGKKRDDLKTIPVAGLTTSTPFSDTSTSYSSHANAYVTKPIDFDVFEK
jgi:CheY-like chemotaxis protein